MRIVAIDYGRARIGLAISDPRKIIASPLKTLKVGNNLVETARLIACELATLPDIETAIIGHPLLLNGQEGEMALEVRKFLSFLTPLCPFPILLVDERLTSAFAEKMMREVSWKRKKRAQKSDVFAAALLLEAHLMRLEFR